MICTKTLIEIQEKQKDLDKYIIEYNNIDVKKIKDKRLLAFIIEVSEFLNEEKSFKYWKKSIEIDREKLVEEYIDGIHFLMSIINDANLDLKDYIIKKPRYDKLHLIALELMNNITLYWKEKNISFLWEVLDDYLSITELLNISEKELLKTYDKKNKINRERQKSGY